MIIISHKPQLKIFQLSQMESMPLVGTNVGMEKKKFSQILFDWTTKQFFGQPKV
jgi:hypothetical protein